MAKRKSNRAKGKKKRKAQRRPERPILTDWPVESSVPTSDFFAYKNPDEPGDLGWMLDDLIRNLKSGYFLQWEAVISREQGLPLTEKQQAALDDLLYFGDDPTERILYINEIPRPKEPWYALVRKLLPRLVKHPFSTAEVMYDVHGPETWPRLVDVISTHGQHLSLPEGVKAPLDLISLDLRHTLWLQVCFDALYGLGQEEELTLANEEQQNRVSWFVNDLRRHKDTVRYFDLTLATLLQRVILPPEEETLFISMITAELNLPSPGAPLAKYL